MKGFLFRNYKALLMVSTIIGLLEVIIQAGYLSAFIIPTPTSVISSLWFDKALIARHLLITSVEAVGGFFLGSIFAISLSCAFLRFPALERAMLPVAIVLQTLPIVVVSPILVILLGNGLSPKIVVSALITFFPVLVNMTKGLKEVDPDLLNLFDILNARWSQTLWRLRFPVSLTLLFPALRTASANCFIGAIIGEWIAADSGIGYWILIRMHQLKIDSMYAGVISGSLAAMLLYSFVVFMEYISMPWKRQIKFENGGL